MMLLVSLILIILLHELGHLIAAKLLKCDVDVFSVGFGKPFWKKKIGSTVYQLTPLLLGGFCKLRDELSLSKDLRAFTNLTYSKKVVISLAGIAVNCLTGLLAWKLGHVFQSQTLLTFSYYSIILGLSNAIPFPALDGSYPFLLLLEKCYGKEKGCQLMARIVKWGFAIIMFLNIICIPWLLLVLITR